MLKFDFINQKSNVLVWGNALLLAIGSDWRRSD